MQLDVCLKVFGGVGNCDEMLEANYHVAADGILRHCG